MVCRNSAPTTPFVEFMLQALLDAILEAVSTDQVALMIKALANRELGSSELMAALSLNHWPTLRENYLNPALDAGWIERTQPDSPRSPTQRYRVSGRWLQWLKARLNNERSVEQGV
ncbi:MAG: Fic family protein [Methylomonas sp.]